MDRLQNGRPGGSSLHMGCFAYVPGPTRWVKGEVVTGGRGGPRHYENRKIGTVVPILSVAILHVKLQARAQASVPTSDPAGRPD